MISKKYVTCTSCEHKPFCQLNQLGDFNINAIANLLFMKNRRPQRCILDPVEHLDGAFCEKW